MVGATEQTVARISNWQDMIGRLARLEKIDVVESADSKGSAQLVVDEATIYLPLADLMDVDAEKARLQKIWTSSAEKPDRLKDVFPTRSFSPKRQSMLSRRPKNSLSTWKPSLKS